MKKYRIIFIILGVVFFLTALTVYLNRVILPVQIKKLVTAQAENALKRRVEIESLHFNWVKGFIIDKIKIYQKDSDQILLQATRVNFGLIIIPGLKEHHITIPFIHIDEPSLHLIHTGEATWNFSDILSSLTVPSAEAEKPSPFKINVAGIDINNAKMRIDDTAGGRNWTQLLDNINLKVNLSLQGIAFDVATNLPQQQGVLSAQGHYAPMTQGIDGHLVLKNIRPGDYLMFLPPLPGLQWQDGLINNIDVNLQYNKELTSVSGDLSIKGLKVIINGQTVAGDILARATHVTYKNAMLETNGHLELSGLNLDTNGLHAKGNAVLDINEAHIAADALTINGDINLTESVLTLSDDQQIKGNLTVTGLKARKDKDGTQIVTKITADHLDITNKTQHLQGNFSSLGLVVNMSPQQEITATGDIKLTDLKVQVDEERFINGNINLNNTKLRFINPKNITLSSKISITGIQAVPMANTLINGSVELANLDLKLTDNKLNVTTTGELNNWDVKLDPDKSAVIEAEFTVNADCPLDNLAQSTYEGSFQLHDGELDGIPYGPFKAINIDAAFKTDALSVKLFSLMAMDTLVKGSLNLLNFKNPVLDLDANSDAIDLSKLELILPDIVKQYGLQTSGSASVKVQFQGPLSNPLSGSIKGHAQLDNVNIASSIFNQSATGISGSVDATPDSLIWNNFTGTYMGKAYTLTGSLNNFKNPVVKTSLDGEDVSLKADLVKIGDVLTINTLKGKYLKINFDATGTVTLAAGSAPYLDIKSKTNFNITDIFRFIPQEQQKIILDLNPSADLSVDASIKGPATQWPQWSTQATINSPLLSVMGYSLHDININLTQKEGKISNLTADALAYEGKIHLVASGDVLDKLMPFDIALNVDGLDIQKLKNDIPAIAMEDVKGKFYLTTVGKLNASDAKSLQAKGSLAIREGFLTEFKMFKGLLGILNEALRLGQVMITDVEGNFSIENQRLTSDNLRLKSPTIVLLTSGWVGFDQMCDLNVTVDMTSGIVPSIAEEVLRSLQIHIFDKISNPKFTKKISVPQVINSVIKALGILQ